MTHIKIVCDASYDHNLWFSGYAGIINIKKTPADSSKGLPVDTQTFTYQGVAAEQSKSQEGETLAVLAGLRQLAQRQRRESGETYIGCTIDIYTDCQGSRDRFYNFTPRPPLNRNDAEYYYIKEVYDLIAKYDWRVKIHHVDAHIPDLHANVIQKLNNKVDERANNARTKAIKMMLNPHEHGEVSNRVAVLVPKDPININERNAWSRLAYHLAEKGKKIHFYTDGDHENHPFLLALEDFSLMHREELSAIVKICNYTPDFLSDPLNKRELTIIRHHMKMRNFDTSVEFTNSEVHLRAALASRIIFGDPTPSIVHSNFSGRKHSAVDAVYDLMDVLKPDEHRFPNSVQGWLHTFLTYVNIPLEEGLRAAFKRERLKAVVSPETTFSTREEAKTPVGPKGSTDYIPYADEELLSAFLEIYETNIPALKNRELTYNQLARIFLLEYREHGHTFPTYAEASIERFVYAAPKKDPKKFVNRVLKQIRKLSPKPNDPSPEAMMPRRQTPVKKKPLFRKS
ncbi:hypothetical protein [Alteromonas sp. 14N.309.X.WAT.G.H12]|uniref:hypothetical protein n=1 Tax=Alteromonas sp. 14N.309.X.WAT.G.H12 TaxID=3120824 RepID=UPI002FD0ED8A